MPQTNWLTGPLATRGPTRGALPRGPAPPRGPSGWAHAGPKWVGPRGAQVGGPTRAQVGGPTRGPSGPTWGPSEPKPEIWDPKKPKNKNSQNQNPFCPKCRQYFFKPEKKLPAPFGALPAHFLRGPEKSKKCQIFATNLNFNACSVT